MSDITVPPEIRPLLQRALRLQYWNLAWKASIVAVMGITMGQSQTMKSAWIEDMLSLIPPLALMIAAWLELRGRRSARFPFGFERAAGLGFFVSAVSLAAVGALILYDSLSTLISQEHATVASVSLFGRDVWLGWPMIAAQTYALVVPAIIARIELPLARDLSDKLLHTDALMNKANWLTGAAGIAGILGLGVGWWWADSVAAAIISLGIVKDGIVASRSAAAELIDGTPRALEGDALADDALALQAALQKRFPDAIVRLRETGRVIRAELHGVGAPREHVDPADFWPGDPKRAWRLAQISFAPGSESR